MSENISGKFQLIKKTLFEEIKEGGVVELPESDLAIQNDNCLLQFKYHRPEQDRKYEIKPGTYRLSETSSGIVLNKIEVKNEPILESIDNTSRIIAEAEKFFSRLDVYEKRGRTKKRAALLYSRPGMGKTQAIKRFSNKISSADPGTVVFMWPTSEIEADSISRFLSVQSVYLPECTKVILIIEDIGGGERDGDRGKMAVDSGLLDLLDGQGVTFRLPTFIVATTNHPENLLESLANRPGRFDLKMELKPPKFEERCALLEFIAGGGYKVTEADKAALKQKGAAEFSIAHLAEVVIRADLDDKTYPEVILELIKDAEQYNKSFEDKRKMGMGMIDD